jgi:predicted RND superfamily exporter protein
VTSDSLVSRLLSALMDRLIAWKGGILLAGLISVIVAMPVASRLELDQSLESFFAPDDPLIVAWHDSKQWFGGDEFILVAYEDPALLAARPASTAGEEADPPAEDDRTEEDAQEPSPLARLKEFAAALGAVPGIAPDGTQSLESLLRPKFGTTVAARILARAYARMRQEDILEFGEHLVISSDRRTTAVILRLLPEDQSPVPRAETFARIRRIAAAHNPPAFVAGEPIQVHDMFRYVDEDSRLLGWASSGLLMLMILLLFRSLRWVLLPLLVVHVSLVWTKAVLVLSDMHLSMVSSILTSLVTIIGIATVTHITVNYRERRLTLPRVAAFRETFRQLGPPVFWTCTTTAIGFGALLSSQILPIRSFGLMLALAAMLVLAACFVILPGGVLLLRYDSDPRPTLAEARLVRFLERLSRAVDRHPRRWLASLALLTAATGVGLGFLRVETDFSRNFRESSEIVQALRFFEARMGGVGTWEIEFPWSGGITDESLRPLRDLAERLRNLRLPDGTGLTKVIALSDGVDFAPGNSVEQKLERLTAIQPQFIPGLYNAEAGRMRIVLRALEQKPAEVKLALIDLVTRTARETFPEARATGFYLLLAKIISSLLQDQLVSFLLATLGIGVSMTVAFRNLWIGLLSLAPNVFPLVLVIGGMGWIGIPVNIGTAMIASVSMGLTVDSSIHYISGYLRARRRGDSYTEALRSTHGTVGVAMVFANVVLAVGFLVLSLSNFVPLIYFGVLVSLSMIGGLTGSLVLLPLLMRWAPVAPRTVVVPAAHSEPPVAAESAVER